MILFVTGFVAGCVAGAGAYWLVAEWNEYCDRFSGR